jgi:hypothetical protein
MRLQSRTRGLALAFAVGVVVWMAALTGAIDLGRVVSLW